jgi:hypothetical protein
MSRPTMRFVPVKTAEQQADLMLMGLRDRLIRNRTQLTNAIRGYAAEFGVTATTGHVHIASLLERIAADKTLPALARDLFAIQAVEYEQLRVQIDEVGAKLLAWHRANECSRRLAQIPGVGPIGAAMLIMKTPAPALFRSGRCATSLRYSAQARTRPRDQVPASAARITCEMRMSLASRSGPIMRSTSCDTSRCSARAAPAAHGVRSYARNASVSRSDIAGDHRPALIGYKWGNAATCLLNPRCFPHAATYAKLPSPAACLAAIQPNVIEGPTLAPAPG